jgi:hypothetical protein
MEVWNGLTPRRPDLSTTRATSHEDYLVIVQQIQGLQEFTLNLSNNLQLMPDLTGYLKEAKFKINNIQDLIDKISLPQDVKDRLEALEQLINEIDQRATITQLRRDFEILRETVARNQIEVLNLQSSFEKEVKGFQNKVWGLLEKLQKETSKSISELVEKVNHVDAQLDLQTSLEKYNQLKSK